MAQRTRRNELKIYLNDEEKMLLDEKVRNSEMISTTAFIRHLIKYGFVYSVDYEILRDMVEQLRGMAVNINQIAHKVNGTDTVYRSDIEKLQKEMDKVWHIVKSTLSEQPLVEQ
ncbi:MAG: MobC family plasmid mobilization relaxosome protein [Lachnospiraceae bacterium]|nr:MobC family plasmid mobilization relaxosome protein [Lachnospiraceae bacterium]